MSNEFPLQPPGPARRKYLAYVFGSTDGSPDSIPYKLDRDLYEALLRFEARRAALEVEVECYRERSPDGTVAGIPDPARRAALVADFTKSGQHLQDWHAKENQFPALVRKIDVHKFLNPFGVES